MSYLNFVWKSIESGSAFNFTDIYMSFKRELAAAWESENWQIKVLIIETVLVFLLIVSIFVAWKVNGPAISKLLIPDNKIVESKLSKTRNSATSLNSYPR